MALAKYFNVGRRGFMSSIQPPFNRLNAWQFNGSSQYVDVSSLFLNTIGDNEVSIATWFSIEDPNGGSGNKQFIFGLREANTGFKLFYDKSTQELRGRLWSISTAMIDVSLVINPNEWYFVVIQRRKVNPTNWHFELYVNSVGFFSFFNAIHFGDTFNFSSAPLRIGHINSGFYPNDYFFGKIDETTIYNKALSQIEIDYLYNNGLGNLPTVDLSSNILARWNFDTQIPSGPEFILTDNSGNGNNGLSNGAPLLVPV
jgi:hypothetical protein